MGGIARNFEVDRYNARVIDVSAPYLAKGYDLESHRANGEIVAIEVKGRAGRGSVQLTENEWPTAINVRDRYWLYVVADCATNPVLYRVQDPAFKLAVKTRQSFTVNWVCLDLPRLAGAAAVGGVPGGIDRDAVA